MSKLLFSDRTKILRYDRSKKGINDFLAAWAASESIMYPRRQKLIDLYDMVMLDNHLTGLVENIKSKILGETFILINEKGEQSELVSLLQASWFNEFVSHILDARFYGYSLIELKEFNEKGRIKSIALIERRNIVPQKKEVLINTYDTTGIPFDTKVDEDYYIWVDNGLGVLLKAAPMVIYKRSSMASHASFNERFGMPSIIVKTSKTDEEKREIEEALVKLGADGVGVIDIDDIIEYLQASGGADSSKTYVNLGEQANDELSKLILGHTKTADDNEGGLQTYMNKDALNKTPSEERAEQNMENVQNIVNEQLIPRLINFGYPFQGLTFHYNYMWNQKRAENKKNISTETLKVILDHYDIPVEYFKDNFDINVLPKSVKIPQPVAEKPIESESKSENIENKLAKALLNTIDKANVFGDAIYKETLSAFYGNLEVENNLDDDLKKLFGKFESIYRRIVMGIYKNGAVFFDKILALQTAKYLEKALISYENPDPAKLKALRENIYLFSGAKTYQQLKEISDLLIDADGNPRNLQDFITQVTQINSSYNLNYLATEYNHAITCAQMISIWNNLVDSDPNVILQYSAVGDDLTTPLCQQRNGITLPATDSFWALSYPPNHWRCRSTVIPMGVGTALVKPPANLAQPKGIFAGNVALDGVIFPNNHPFFNNIPKDIETKIKGFSKTKTK